MIKNGFSIFVFLKCLIKIKTRRELLNYDYLNLEFKYLISFELFIFEEN